jgi:hypothetical protein
MQYHLSEALVLALFGGSFASRGDRLSRGRARGHSLRAPRGSPCSRSSPSEPSSLAVRRRPATQGSFQGKIENN